MGVLQGPDRPAVGLAAGRASRSSFNGGRGIRGQCNYSSSLQIGAERANGGYSLPCLPGRARSVFKLASVIVIRQNPQDHRMIPTTSHQKSWYAPFAHAQERSESL